MNINDLLNASSSSSRESRHAVSDTDLEDPIAPLSVKEFGKFGILILGSMHQDFYVHYYWAMGTKG